MVVTQQPAHRILGGCTGAGGSSTCLGGLLTSLSGHTRPWELLHPGYYPMGKIQEKIRGRRKVSGGPILSETLDKPCRLAPGAACPANVLLWILATASCPLKGDSTSRFLPPPHTLLNRPHIKLSPQSSLCFPSGTQYKHGTLLTVEHYTLNCVAQHFLLDLSSFNP